MKHFTYLCTNEDDGLEVRDILRKRFDFSGRLRNKIKREKLMLHNGKDTEGWYKVKCGDEISITLPDEESHFLPQAIPLDIIFEDEDLLIVNKSPGLIVHPTKGHPVGTVANALSYRMEQTGDKWKIRFVNRLDMDTSGLLLVAKNSYCQNDITKQMKKNLIEKKYIAIVVGIIDDESGTIELPIGRPDPDDVRRGVTEDGAPSVTHYKVLERFKKNTLVELVLETGRTHQIRVHMSYIGHPVLGDHLYGGENVLIIERQALHAARLKFTHPMTGEKIQFEAPLPYDMKEAISKCRK